MGKSTTASAIYSTAMGYLTIASGTYSTAMGRDTTASASYSTAMGYSTTASGQSSTAMGQSTTASGTFSTAMGYSTTSSGDWGSCAMGSSTIASGATSTAMGRSTTASGSWTTAMGVYTTASGDRAYAMGQYTKAEGDYSTAIGNGAYTGGNIGFAVGCSSTNGTVAADIASASDNNNKFVILENGNVGIGTSSPLSHAKLHVNGTLFLGAGTGLLDGTLGGCIDFESRDSGAYGSSNYSSALIGTRTHNYSTVVTNVNNGADDKMEMVFFIGNNPTSSYGPDRFSFIGGEFRIHTPSSTYTPTSGIRGWDALDEMGNTYQNSTPAFIVDGGRVGIGTSTPRAGLEVVATVSTNGNVGVDDDTIVYLSEASTGDTSGPYDFNSNAYQVSIIGAGLIYAKLYVGASDERIKKNIVEVNDDLALKKVRDISCCWYNYIDYLSSSSRKTIGFIAQQVKEHLPEAVQQITDFLPDIMKQIHTSWNETKMSSNDLQDVSGIKYRFYVNNVIDDNEKMVELVGDENNCFTFKEKWENLFCYGKAVDDFHTLDKQKLFALNFSATQEIDRIQQYEKTKLEAAEAKIIALEAENSALKERLDAIEARLNVGGL